MYSWIFICIPFAYLAKVAAKSDKFQWLSPVLIYIVGYGPFLLAVSFARVVEPDRAERLKAEARRRAEAGEFFGFIAFVSFIARKGS